MDTATPTLWTGPFPIEGVSGHFYIITILLKFLYLSANSVDTDQMPCFAASDMCLYCLSIILLWDAIHKQVKCTNVDKFKTLWIAYKKDPYNRKVRACSGCEQITIFTLSKGKGRPQHTVVANQSPRSERLIKSNTVCHYSSHYRHINGYRNGFAHILG